MLQTLTDTNYGTLPIFAHVVKPVFQTFTKWGFVPAIPRLGMGLLFGLPHSVVGCCDLTGGSMPLEDPNFLLVQRCGEAWEAGIARLPLLALLAVC